MTDQQTKAIRSLERALKKCAEAGLLLFGMDDNLLAVTREDYEAAGGYAQSFEALGALQERGMVTVKDGGAYTDSGGW